MSAAKSQRARIVLREEGERSQQTVSLRLNGRSLKEAAREWVDQHSQGELVSVEAVWLRSRPGAGNPRRA